jgi:hypothetical protein
VSLGVVVNGDVEVCPVHNDVLPDAEDCDEGGVGDSDVGAL